MQLALERTKEFQSAMSFVIDELRACQKTLRGNFLLQVVEKIMHVQKQNAINTESIHE